MANMIFFSIGCLLGFLILQKLHFLEPNRYHNRALRLTFSPYLLNACLTLRGLPPYQAAHESIRDDATLTHPQLLHHRPYRSRQVDAGRPADSALRRAYGAGDEGA